MSTIELGDQAPIPLRPLHLVGRSRAMHTSIRRPEVSAQHVSIRWDGTAWRVRDLASRNGTRIDGVPLEAGSDAEWKVGTTLEVGAPTVRLVLVDAAPPVVLATHGDDVLAGEATFLSIPNPLAVVFMENNGWVVAEDGEPVSIFDGTTLRVDGQPWTLCLPTPIAATSATVVPSSRTADIALRFRLSADEEYVEMTVALGEVVHVLSPRAHHELALSLARAWL